jgi:uncharacterized membrane protein
MESEICLALAVVGLAVLLCIAGVILGATALMRTGMLHKRLAALELALEVQRRSAPRDQTAAVPGPAVPQPVAPPPVPPAAGAAAPGPAPKIAAQPLPAASTRPIPLPWTPPSRAQREQGLASLESNIGQRWIAWVGAIVVFLSVVFFLKYAFQNDWIGPTGQVVISALGGLTLVAAGSYFLVRQWRIFGQCLMGLGLAILYAAFYGAFQLYHPPVMGQNSAFLFMIAVTVVGMTLAVLHNAKSMAFLTVLGGILTPVLVSTGQDSRDVLFTYMLVLDLGVLGVAFFRRWRLLDTLALVGTLIMYAGWWERFYWQEISYTSAGPWPALSWLGGIYLLFLILPFTYHLVRKQPVTVERFIMAVANAAFAASFAWYMLRVDYLHTMGFVALGMAAAYLLLGALLAKRVPVDARAVFGTIAMTVTFLTLAVPMQLHAQGIMLAWVAEAPVLAFIAWRFRYLPVRVMAFLVLVVGIGRLFAAHWPLHHGFFVAFANKEFWSAMAVPAAAAAFALVQHVYRGQQGQTDRALKVIAALGGGFLALVIVHVELFGWLRNDVSEYAAWCAVAALWAAGTVAYLVSSLRAGRSAPAVWGTAALTAAVAAVTVIGAYTEDLATTHVLFANARFAAGLLVVAAALALAWAIHRSRTAAGVAETAGVLAIITLVGGLTALLALLSTEVYTFCTDVITEYTTARRAGQMSITLVWSVYAAGLLWVGFWRRWRWVRWGALGLFGISAIKLMAVDLSFLKDVPRIIAFLVLGLLMLAASYLYHRLEKRLRGADEKTSPAPVPAGDGL